MMAIVFWLCLGYLLYVLLGFLPSAIITTFLLVAGFQASKRQEDLESKVEPVADHYMCVLIGHLLIRTKHGLVRCKRCHKVIPQKEKANVT